MSTLSIPQLQAALGEVIQEMCIRFADDPAAHEEPAFAAAALIIPEVKLREVLVRARVVARLAFEFDNATLPMESARQSCEYALHMLDQQFNLQGQANDTQLENLARQRLQDRVRRADPLGTCEFPDPIATRWVNPEHLAGSPRLATRVQFARGALRSVLATQALEASTPIAPSTSPSPRL